MGVNKIKIGSTELINLTDTTAEQSDVAVGKYFYDKNGDRLEGTSSGGGSGAAEYPFPTATGSMVDGSAYGYMCNPNVTTIRDYAFYFSPNLQSVTLPIGITSIGSYAFGNCTKIKNTWWFNGSNCTVGDNAFAGCTQLENGYLSGCTTIGNNVFANDVALQYATLPAAVTVGNLVFNGCNQLVDVSFGENNVLQSIGQSCFRDCINLHTLTLPTSCTTIGSAAFAYSGIREISAPSVTVFPSQAFYSNSYITSIDTSTSFPSITSVTGTQQFYLCSQLTSAVCNNLPVGHATMPATNEQLFGTCSRLTNVELMSAVAIPRNSFTSCTQLRRLVIPSGVTCHVTSNKQVLFSEWDLDGDVEASIPWAVQMSSGSIRLYKNYGTTITATLNASNPSYTFTSEVNGYTYTITRTYGSSSVGRMTVTYS